MRRLRSKVMLVILCLVTFLPLPGCWGVREPDELGFILLTGLDKGDINILKATFQIAIPQATANGGGGGESQEKTEIITVEAGTLFGALQLANAFVNRDLTFIHNRMVVISEELAREGLNIYINPLIRSREIRRNTFLVIAKGSAKEFIETNKPRLETYPARQFELLYVTQKYTGFILDSILNSYYIAEKSLGQEAVTGLVGLNKADGTGKKVGDDPQTQVLEEFSYLPGEIPREGGNKADIIGLAVFKSDRLAGELNGTETRYFEMLQGGYNSSILSFPDPEKPAEYRVIMELKRGRAPSVAVNVSGERPQVKVSLFLEGEIMSIQSGINYEQGPKQSQLEQYISAIITRECEKLIRKTQDEYGCDIFGFGEKARRNFWTMPQWRAYNWPDKYPTAEIEVNTKVEIRRTGLMIRTTPKMEE